MEKVCLVTIELGSEKDNWRLEDVVVELTELTRTCGAQVVDTLTCLRDKPTPNLFIGKGKAEEIALLCQDQDIDTVIFSHDLSGTQQRNLEELIGRKAIDRTQLILDIFAQHAKTPEGKLQVELAQLQYLLPRLVGKGVLLSRLGGGIGTRGPGEQKLEVDRRRIRNHIEKLKDDLRDLSVHRKLLRKKRHENAIPSVTLVGYTNAGKSTLINALTDARQLVQESLFTTLDPISKAMPLADIGTVIISDTVGFLHRLPHHLIEAFKATLEEVAEADLLIHVLDVSHSRVYEHAQAVSAVLQQLQADQIPLITALNKIDLLNDPAWLNRLKHDFPNTVAISAKLKQNLERLRESIRQNFKSRMAYLEAIIPLQRMDLVNLLYQQGQVKEIDYQQSGIKIKVFLPKNNINNLLKNKEIKKVDQNI